MEILQLDHYIIIRRKMYFRFFLSFLTSIQFIRMIKGKDRTCQHPFPSPPPPPVSSFRLYHRSGWRVIKTIIHGVRVYSPREGGGRGRQGEPRRRERSGEKRRVCTFEAVSSIIELVAWHVVGAIPAACFEVVSIQGDVQLPGGGGWLLQVGRNIEVGRAR